MYCTYGSLHCLAIAHIGEQIGLSYPKVKLGDESVHNSML